MKKILYRPRRNAGALSRILSDIGNHFKINITPCFPLFIFFSVFCYFYFLFQLYDLFFAICAMIKIICVIFLIVFLEKSFVYFLNVFPRNLFILIVLIIILIMILIVIAMIIKITSGLIFNLCFWLFVDRKITIYFSYLIITCMFTIYILFSLNWIIK